MPRCTSRGGWVTNQLREFDRCRVLYEKFLEFNPANVYAWIKYAELENLLEEVWFDLIKMEAMPDLCSLDELCLVLEHARHRRSGAAASSSWPLVSRC